MSEYKRASNSSNRKTKRKRKTSNLIFKILGLIYLAITIMFYISTVKTDIIPMFYLIIFTIVEVVLTLGLSIGIMKYRKTIKTNVICLIIAIIISTGYIYASNYINATMDFLGTMFSEVHETDEYYVVVRNNNTYNSIEDLKDKEIAIFKVVEDVKNEVSNKANIKFKETDSVTDMGNNLIKGEEAAILVSSTQYSILTEEIEDFKANTKIIYTAKHKVQTSTEVLKGDTKYSIGSGVFNVYISGIDTSGNITNVARSDANILATINTKTHEVLLTSIPRDYYVTLHEAGAKDKLTHSGIYGINETVTTVEDLLETDINYYIRVNFTTVIKLVDKLGGIDVYSDYEFTRGGYTFKKGYNHVNGDAALVFSRERKSFASGDNQRIKNQQHVIEAIIKKALNGTTILTKYTSILNALEGSFQTNINQGEISDLIKEQLESMSSWTIKTNSLTGTGATKTTYSMGSTPLYVMIPDENSVQEAKDKIDELIGK